MLPKDALLDILSSAERLKSLLDVTGVPSPVASSSKQDFSTEFDSTLPQIPEVLEELVAIGLGDDSSTRLSEAYYRSAHSLREIIRSQYLQNCRSLHLSTYNRSQLRTTLHNIFSERVDQWAKTVVQKARERMQVVAETQNQMPNRQSSGGFNQSYIPVLEAFFAEDQFPSRPDKLLLAKKSGMTYRQIHIWFQNRRSRMRKAGGSSIAQIRCGRNELSGSDETDVEEVEKTSSRSSSFTLVADAEPFACIYQTHSFPTKYPPDFDRESDPFPCRFGDFSGFQKPTWIRRSAEKHLTYCTLSVSDLASLFGRLDIGEAPIDEANFGIQKTSQRSGHNVMEPYFIRVPKAPLPAFLPDPSRYRDLRPCPLFRPTQHRDNPVRGADISPGKSSAICAIPSRISVASDTRQCKNADGKLGKRAKKKSGPPRRMPASSFTLNTIHQTQVSRTVSTDLPSTQESMLHLTIPPISTFRSVSTQPHESLSSSQSSYSSSSETHSPLTPDRILVGDEFENALFASSGQQDFLSTFGQASLTVDDPPYFTSFDYPPDILSDSSIECNIPLPYDQFVTGPPSSLIPLAYPAVINPLSAFDLTSIGG